MTPKELHDELERLAEKATPGEWEVQDGCSWRRVGTRGRDGNVICPTNHPADRHPDLCARDSYSVTDNLLLACALQNNLPTLLRALSALDALEGVKGALEEVENLRKVQLRNALAGLRCAVARLITPEMVGPNVAVVKHALAETEAAYADEGTRRALSRLKEAGL